MHGITEKARLVAAPSDGKEGAKPSFINPFAALGIILALLAVCFAKPLLDLGRLAWAEDFHSHLPLIPVISAYLIWTRKAFLPPAARGSFAIVLVGAGLAAAFLVAPVVLAFQEPVAILSLRILSLVVFAVTAVTYLLGPAFARSIAFPLAFLIFTVPMPAGIRDPLEIASQHASAEVYSWMMDLTRSTYYREGLHFALPGLRIQVAQECSGIRSSFVLFIVSLLAGYLFLSSPYRRLAFAFFVFPLGLARNAFRIFTLTTLTVHWDPNVINGPLHHKGGPVFFALSLIPFALVLMWLSKSERKKQTVHKPA